MSIQHLFITFLIGVIIYLYSIKESFSNYSKTFAKDGVNVNKDLKQKLKQRINTECKNVTNEKVKSNIIANKRLNCRYLSRCKDITDMNYNSWAKPKVSIVKTNVKGITV
jgi:predicted membrane protein